MEFGFEKVLDYDRLMAPVPGDHPGGVLLRNEEAYDQLKNALKPQDSDLASGVKGPDYNALIRSAADMIARKSKDLDIATWLTELLTRQYGLTGLTEGVLVMQGLVDNFWPTLFPEIDPDDGDEGFRARPILRLNTAFVGVLNQLDISADRKTLFEFNASCEMPTEAQADNNGSQRTKREKAIAEGIARVNAPFQGRLHLQQLAQQA